MPVWDTIGKVRITPKGQFDSSNEYEILDVVFNSSMNRVYIARRDVPMNSSLSDTAYWVKMLDVSDASIVIGDSIANNLTTTESGKVLDARQGKILNDSKLNTSDVVNNLTTSTAGKALDAKQGKALNDKLSGVIIEASSTISIPSSGSSRTVYIDELTSKHRLVQWNFSSSAENNPPANLTVSTYNGYFTITNNGGTTSETIKPVFILGTKAATY